MSRGRRSWCISSSRAPKHWISALLEDIADFVQEQIAAGSYEVTGVTIDGSRVAVDLRQLER
jgi:poly(3-hydroxyalkanoate) synthetase